MHRSFQQDSYNQSKGKQTNSTTSQKVYGHLKVSFRRVYNRKANGIASSSFLHRFQVNKKLIRTAQLCMTNRLQLYRENVAELTHLVVQCLFWAKTVWSINMFQFYQNYFEYIQFVCLFLHTSQQPLQTSLVHFLFLFFSSTKAGMQLLE